MRTVFRTKDIPAAWEREYSRLGRALSLLIPRGPTVIGEIGCGRGQLTVPLALASPRARIFAVDQFSGPYSGHQGALEAALQETGLRENVSVVAEDGLGWLARQPPRTLHAVVSSEFLPELTSAEMSAFFRSSSRTIIRGGVTAHVFLSPTPRNRRQWLTIEADSSPLWSSHPPKEWFAPIPEMARNRLVKTGFSEVRIRSLLSGTRFIGPAASRQLRLWGVRETFDRRYREELADGVELPDWILLSGVQLS